MTSDLRVTTVCVGAIEYNCVRCYALLRKMCAVVYDIVHSYDLFFAYIIVYDFRCVLICTSSLHEESVHKLCLHESVHNYVQYRTHPVSVQATLHERRLPARRQ